MSFVTLAGPAEHAEVIGGSDFLVYAQRADAPEEALAALERVRERHPDATHHCWAYKIGTASRFSDGGEPGGTAGAPILRTIEGQGLDYVVVVVVRYYGGTKLGTGGLVRAYGGSAAECLRMATREEVKPRAVLKVRVRFEHLSVLHRLLDGFGVRRGAEQYDEHGLQLEAELLEEQAASFALALRDATRGQGEVIRVGEA